MTAPAPRTMAEPEKGAVLARYKLRAVKNDHRAKDFHRTKALARQKQGGGGRNPPHGAPSAPERTRILAREPESTARSLFRAKISPRSPHKGHSAPEIRRIHRTEPFPRQEPAETTARAFFRTRNPPGTQRVSHAKSLCFTAVTRGMGATINCPSCSHRKVYASMPLQGRSALPLRSSAPSLHPTHPLAAPIHLLRYAHSSPHWPTHSPPPSQGRRASPPRPLISSLRSLIPSSCSLIPSLRPCVFGEKLLSQVPSSFPDVGVLAPQALSHCARQIKRKTIGGTGVRNLLSRCREPDDAERLKIIHARGIPVHRPFVKVKRAAVVLQANPIPRPIQIAVILTMVCVCRNPAWGFNPRIQNGNAKTVSALASREAQKKSQTSLHR